MSYNIAPYQVLIDNSIKFIPIIELKCQDYVYVKGQYKNTM